MKTNGKKVVILNAPPMAGKDTLANHLAFKHGCKHVMFKSRLIEMVKVVYGLNNSEFRQLTSRRFKEVGHEKFNGMSAREAMIDMSENIIKPNFGNNYFGQSLLSDLSNGVNIVSDGGFISEVESIVDAVGADNVLVLKIIRDGFNFDGDSRSYLDGDYLGGKGVLVKSIKNVDVDPFLKESTEYIKWWVSSLAK